MELGSVRTHKLLGSGVPKMAQKLVEEAAEAAIEAVQDQRETFVQESADLLFNLAVLWQALDIKPGDIWAEMDRRESLFGLAGVESGRSLARREGPFQCAGRSRSPIWIR